MAVSRPTLSLISLIILAGALLLQFFVVLSGGVNSSPENLIYFLRSTTNGIDPQPRNPSSWTFWAICGVDNNNHNVDCGKSVPALPFHPPHRTNFGTTRGVPSDFIGTNRYYYLSRFMFAFYLMSLVFASFALFTGLLALCSRLGGYISGFNTTIALFFHTLAAALMTSWTVQGRNVFRRNGQTAHVGVKAQAFTWTAWACLLISTILFCAAGSAGRDRSRATTSRNRFPFASRMKTAKRETVVEPERRTSSYV